MKKKIISSLLVLLLVMQCIPMQIFAATGWNSNLSTTSTAANEGGMIIRYNKISTLANGNAVPAGTDCVRLDFIANKTPYAGLRVAIEPNAGLVSPVNKNTGRVAPEGATTWYSTDNADKIIVTQAVYDYDQDYGDATLTLGQEVNFYEAKVGVMEDQGLYQDGIVDLTVSKQTDSVARVANWLTQESGKTKYDPGNGQLVFSYYFLIKENDQGITSSNITPEQFFTSLPHVDLAADTSLPLNVDAENKLIVDITGFPAPAAAPTNVTVSVDPVQIVSGGTATITAGADAPADGGTLSYALYSNTTDSTSGGALVTDFQAGTTFTVSPTTDTYYYVVVKNTKADDGSTAVTTSATTVKVSVLQSISAVTASIAAPAAGETPATTITETAQYTGTIGWDPATEGSFAGSTAYTAKVTLTAKTGYLFASSLSNSDVTVAGATIANTAVQEQGAKLYFEATFPATDKTAAELVAEAKTVVEGADFSVNQKVNGSGDAMTDATTAADIKSAVQAKLDGLSLNGVTATAGDPTISQAAVPGTSASPNGTNGSYSVTITLTKGSATDTVTLTGKPIVAKAASKKAQNEAAVKAAIASIEGAAYEAVNMADKNSAAALKAYVEGVVAGLGLDSGITTVVNGTFSAAAAGTYENRPGTAGSYSFTVEVSKGTEPSDGQEEANIDKDYKVTETSEAKTIVINPTAFTAQVTAPGSVRAAAGFEELAISWNAPQTNGVPVSGYALTIRDSKGQVFRDFDSKDMGTATATTVKQMTNGETYRIEVKVTFADLLEAQTLTCEGTPVAGDPAPIQIVQPAVTQGAITITRADGTPIDFAEVRVGMYVKLTAKPAAGMKFKEWKRLAVMPTGSLMNGSFEQMGTGTTSTENPMTVSVEEAAIYEAVFEPMTSVSTSPAGATLDYLGILSPADRALIQENGTAGFNSQNLKYEVYFTSNETPEIGLVVGSLFGDTDIAVDGTPLAIDDTTAAGVEAPYVGKTTVSSITDGQTIQITASRGGITSTYEVKAHVLTPDQDPKITLELDASKGGTRADLSVKIQNAEFTGLRLGINLPAGIFHFSDIGKNVLTSQGGMDLGGNGDNYYGLFTEGVEISKMTVNDDGTYLELTLKTPDDKALVTNANAAGLIKFYLNQTTTGGIDAKTVEQLLAEGIDVTAPSIARVYDQRFNELDLTVNTTLLEKRVADMYQIGGFVQMPQKAIGRARYQVEDMRRAASEQVRVPDGALNEYGLMMFKGVGSDYRFTVTADGYLTMVKNVNGVASNTRLDAMMLLAGDLNGDGTIDVDDRDLLLSVLNSEVTPGESANDGTQDVFADFNNDGIIDVFDMGALLANYGRTSE